MNPTNLVTPAHLITLDTAISDAAGWLTLGDYQWFSEVEAERDTERRVERWLETRADDEYAAIAPCAPWAL